MRSKGLIIFLIVLLMIIIVALIGFLVLCLNGTIDFHNFKISLGTRKSDQLIYNETYNIVEVNSIDVKQDAGDIIFENTEEDNIRVEIYGENTSDFEVVFNNNELKIDYTKNNKGGFLNFGKVTGDIKVYVPVTFNGNIKIRNDAGEVKTKNLQYANIDVDCDAGNVEIREINKAKIKCDAGNVKIEKILGKCDIKLNCGNLRIEKMEIKENSTIETDMGNVNIEEIKDVHVEGHVDMGKCNISNNNMNSNVILKIDSDMGNITVK